MAVACFFSSFASLLFLLPSAALFFCLNKNLDNDSHHSGHTATILCATPQHNASSHSSPLPPPQYHRLFRTSVFPTFFSLSLTLASGCWSKLEGEEVQQHLDDSESATIHRTAATTVRAYHSTTQYFHTLSHTILTLSDSFPLQLLRAWRIRRAAVP